jgi:peptidoglycan hydrolase-like protein with peptidoglycan-binding domain
MALTKRELIVNKALEKAPTVIGGDPDNKYMRAGYVMGATGWICTQARLDAQAKAYSDYASMIRKYGPQWLNMPCYDCAQLERVAAKAAGYALVSGANSQKNMPGAWEDEGPISSLPSDSRGLALFVIDPATKRAKHVAVCLGDGTEVEARGHKYGVVRRRMQDTSFTIWKKLTGLDSDSATPIIVPLPVYDSPAYSKPTLKLGTKGGYVAEMQTALVTHGNTALKPDGIFGPKTLIALKTFQGLNGLTVDGICGPKTWAQLLEEPEVNPPLEYTVTIPDRSLAEANELIKTYPSATMAEERN